MKELLEKRKALLGEVAKINNQIVDIKVDMYYKKNDFSKELQELIKDNLQEIYFTDNDCFICGDVSHFRLCFDKQDKHIAMEHDLVYWKQDNTLDFDGFHTDYKAWLEEEEHQERAENLRNKLIEKSKEYGYKFELSQYSNTDEGDIYRLEMNKDNLDIAKVKECIDLWINFETAVYDMYDLE